MKKINKLIITLIMISGFGCANPQDVSQNTKPTLSATPSVIPTSTPSVATNNSEQKENILSISGGSSFGMCLGYCSKQITVNSGKIIISKSSSGRGPKETYPDVNKEETFAVEKWNDLLKFADFKKFSQLAETIGCPDCADGGAEWIEIETSAGKKRVTFEFNKTIPGMESLVDKVRDLRTNYLSKIDQ